MEPSSRNKEVWQAPYCDWKHAGCAINHVASDIISLSSASLFFFLLTIDTDVDNDTASASVTAVVCGR